MKNKWNKEKTCLQIKSFLGIICLVFLCCGIFENRYSIDLTNISVQITNPSNNACIAPGDSIVFQARINSTFSHLKCVWSIPDNNIVFDQPASDSNIIEYTCPRLSKGDHTVNLEIYNDDGEKISTSIAIHSLIKLYPPYTPKDTVYLSWSPVDKSIFSAYLIYRLQTCIDTIYQNNDTSYSDIQIHNDSIYTYQIYVKTKDGRVISSNEQTAAPGSLITLNMPVRKAIINRKSGIVYAIVGNSNPWETYSGKSGLIVIDVLSHCLNKQIQSTIQFTDIDFDESSGTICLCNGIDNKLFLINSANLDEVLYIPISMKALKVEIGQNHRIYYIADSSPNQQCKLMTVDINKKCEISSGMLLNGGNDEDIELSNDNRYIYYSSGDFLQKIDLTVDSIPQIIKSTSLFLFYDYTSLILSEQNTKVCIHNYIFDNDLNWFCCIDYFSTIEIVLSLSPSDNIALGRGYFYDLNLKTNLGSTPFNYNMGLFLSESELMLISTNQQPLGYRKSFFYFYKFK